MSSESSVSVAHLLAAREGIRNLIKKCSNFFLKRNYFADLSQIYKTASGKTRHSCKINKVQMGAVSTNSSFFCIKSSFKKLSKLI